MRSLRLPRNGAEMMLARPVIEKAMPAKGMAEPVVRDLAGEEHNRGAREAAERADQRAASEELPDIARGPHQGREEADREARPKQHQFAAVAVGDLAP